MKNNSNRPEQTVCEIPSGESREWNWHPALPVEVTPLFDAPPRPFMTLKWFARAWLPLSELLVYVGLAYVIWLWVQPSLEQTQLFRLDWVAGVWLRNLFLYALLATGLHLWLYTWKKQGDALRYGGRSPTAKGKLFAFGNQLWDNVAYSLLSGVTIWTIYETLLWWGYSNGALPSVSFSGNPVWFILWFWLVVVWYSFHFYWVHRFMHWAPFYKIVHSVHHRNVAVGPWSGFAMHPVEVLIYLSSLIIHLIVPSHPVHMLFHAYFLTLSLATSHSGYDAVLLGENQQIKAGKFFHQLHHRYFDCNYGNEEMPWDRWFGSFHDGTPEGLKRVRAKK